MFAVIPAIATFFATAFSSLIKHPVVTKMIIFSFFIGIITYSIGFMKDIVSPYIVNNDLFSVAAYFGILDGLSLYITIIISGFGVKQVLAFIRS